MSKYEKYSDEQLLELLRNGDSAILDYLMEKYKNLVRTRAKAMFLIGGDTEDLVQEGMIGLFKAVRDYRHEHDTLFSTFARLCIDRQLYSAIEASTRQKNQPLNSYVSLSEEQAEETIEPMWNESPESIIVDRAHTDEMLEKIHQKLSPFENHVLDLYLSGNDYVQIAEMTDKAPKSIDNALQRIRSKVKSI